MYNLDTTNRTFTDIAMQYKSEGILNWNWILYTNNQDVCKLDPYDTNLSMEDKLIIVLECFKNPIYFFREILKIPTMDGGSIRFPINKGSAAQIFLNLYRDKSCIDLYCRQSLKTITALSIMIYEFIFDKSKSLRIQSFYNTDAKRDLVMLTKIMNLLPDYITFWRKYNKEIKNVSMIRNPVNDTTITTGKGIRNSMESFECAGTGFNSNFALLDDIACKEYFKYYMNRIAAACNALKSILNIPSIVSDTEWLHYIWDCALHWNDKYYDYSKDNFDYFASNFISNIILIHYEPEDILTKEQIRHNYLLLQDKEIFRNEMCIKPFDDNFNIDEYIEEYCS